MAGRLSAAEDWSDLLAKPDQDGSFERDDDLDGKPDFWLQVQETDRDFRHYGVVGLRKGKEGERAVVLTANGTHVAVETRNPIPIDPAFSYFLDGWLSLEGVEPEGGAASVAVVWLDGQKRRLSVEPFYRQSREGEGAFETTVHTIPREARFVQVRLELVQANRPGRGPTIQGRVAYDRVRFYRRPRSEFEVGNASGVFWQGGEPPVFTSSYHELPKGTYRILQEIRDFQGRVAAREEADVEPVASELERVWRPENLPAGWFVWSTQLTDGPAVLGQKKVPFVILVPDEALHLGFGIDCDGGAVPVPRAIMERIPRLRPSFVKWGLPHDDAQASASVSYLKRLKLAQAQIFGVVRPPPEKTLLQWLEEVHSKQEKDFLSHFAQGVDLWHLDETGGTSVTDHRWTLVRSWLEGSLPSQGRRLLIGTRRPYQPEGMDLLEEAPVPLPKPTGNDEKRMVTLRGLAGEWSPGPDLSAAVADFIRSVARYKHVGAGYLAIQAMGEGGAWDAGGKPTPFLGAWSQMQKILNGTRAWKEAQPSLPAGADGWIFERQDQLVILVWSDHQVEWLINLGAGVVAQDLMGNRLDVQPTPEGTLFKLGPVPIYIQGVDREVIRTLLSIQVDPDVLPAREGPIPITLSFTNHLLVPMHGTLEVDLGPDWRIRQPVRDFSLPSGGSWNQALTTYPSRRLLTEGKAHPLRVTLRWRAHGQERVLRWNQKMGFVPEGFVTRYSLAASEKSDAVELFHEVENTGREPLVLASDLSVPGRAERSIQFEVVPAGARTQAIHRLTRGDLVAGAELSVREIRGKRRFWRTEVQ